MNSGDLPARIDNLERRAAGLAQTIETCRKAMLIAKAVMTLGAAAFAADLLGLLRLAPALTLSSIGAVIGGIVVFGSHHSTRLEAEAQLRALEQERGGLIDGLNPRVVTLH